MLIEKLIVKNYRALKNLEMDFNEHLNIIVADNECGKSTILEAVNLALSGQLNGRSIHNELHPFLFNQDAVNEYIEMLISGKPGEPPKILIEVYFKEHVELARMKGTNNSLKKNSPGVIFAIEFDESYKTEFQEYVAKPEAIRTIPIEYYTVFWGSFAFDMVTWRSIPVRPTFIDASNIRHNAGANKYIVDIMKDFLDPKQKVQLALSYRKIKDQFLADENVAQVNKKLLETKDNITNKNLSVSLDSSSKSNWESGIETQLDDIPLSLAGKGEQNSIKIKLAMESADNTNVFLIEEPENHLSFSNLNKLINKIRDKSGGKQLIVTTHSSFVLNKLGIENVILLGAENKSITLKKLSPDTQDYFLKLPGHETLRLILSSKAILVEGPSDELVVQKAFVVKYGCMPLEKGVDVISVKGLAFKRFLEISAMLNIETRVVTDNDGNVEAVKKKYEDFRKHECIKICYDLDTNFKTLEPQLLKSNDLKTLNKVLDKDYKSNEELLSYMTNSNNKTDCALKIFNSTEPLKFPDYILSAINE